MVRYVTCIVLGSVVLKASHVVIHVNQKNRVATLSSRQLELQGSERFLFLRILHLILSLVIKRDMVDRNCK